MKKSLIYHIDQGPSLTYYKNYNLESESWWPKFDTLRSRYGIKIVQGGSDLKVKKSANVKRPEELQAANPIADKGNSSSTENLVDLTGQSNK